MKDKVAWARVSGGTCNYGDQHLGKKVVDLLWSKTQITFGQFYTNCSMDIRYHPKTEVTHKEAMAFAESHGARLPTSVEWEWAASGPQCRQFPWGNDQWGTELANIADTFVGRPCAVGSFPKGATPEGLLDMAGNVWELTDTKLPNEGVIIRGGSYCSSILHIRTKFLNSAPIQLRSKGIGFRIVREL